MLITLPNTPDAYRGFDGEVIDIPPAIVEDAEHFARRVACSTSFCDVAKSSVIGFSIITCLPAFSARGRMLEVHRGWGCDENCVDPAIRQQRVDLLVDVQPKRDRFGCAVAGVVSAVAMMLRVRRSIDPRRMFVADSSEADDSNANLHHVTTRTHNNN